MTVTTDKTDKAVITVRMPRDLYERIERDRGLIPREAWAREAFKVVLDQHDRPTEPR